MSRAAGTGGTPEMPDNQTLSMVYVGSAVRDNDVKIYVNLRMSLSTK